MPNRKRKLDTSQPSENYEITIDQAVDFIMTVWEAIEYAKKGKRGDILTLQDTYVSLPAKLKNENSDVVVTVCPEEDPPTLRLVED
jgi:hypothetical protein